MAIPFIIHTPANDTVVSFKLKQDRQGQPMHK